MVESAKKFLRKVPIPHLRLILGMRFLWEFTLFLWDMQQLGPFICVLGSLLMILVIFKIILQ